MHGTYPHYEEATRWKKQHVHSRAAVGMDPLRTSLSLTTTKTTTWRRLDTPEALIITTTTPREDEGAFTPHTLPGRHGYSNQQLVAHPHSRCHSDSVLLCRLTCNQQHLRTTGDGGPAGVQASHQRRPCWPPCLMAPRPARLLQMERRPVQQPDQQQPCRRRWP